MVDNVVAGSRGNKAHLIRQYLEAHPDAMPKKAAEDLQSQGYDIQPQAISLVKHQLKKAAAAAADSDTAEAPAPQTMRRGRRKKSARARVAAGRAAAADAPVSFDALYRAKEFVAQLGGVAKARAALDALARLTD